MKGIISCSTCEKILEERYLCERVGGSQSPNTAFDINIRSILAFRGIGCGYSAIKQWCGIMNMPHCLSQGGYTKNMERLEKSSLETFSAISEKTKDAIVDSYGEIGVLPDENGVLDIAVSFDGSWQKRGYSSHNGMASVIDLITGFPIDFEVLSNYCNKCKIAEENPHDPEWQAKHSPNCPKNFDGTAGATEAESAKRIWNRSIDKHKFRHTTIPSDGDSKAYSAVIQDLYWRQQAAIRIDNDLSKYVEIKRGVRQGCVLSPDLFSLYSEMIMREVKDMDGIKVNGENITNVRYADDTALIADSEKKLQDIVDKIVTESQKLGLSLNVKKTYCMVISKRKETPRCHLKSTGVVIKQVEQFNYLGSMLTSDGRCETEIKRRIGIAKKSFKDLSNILANRKISFDTRKRILKSYVWSVLLYGCETWNISKNMEERLSSVEMWFYRRMLRVSWMDKLSNQTIL